MPHFLCVKNELCCVGKLILRGSRIIIPKSLRPEVLALAHEGHQGIIKTKNRLRSKVWWPKMDSDAEKLCRSCHPCQMVAGYQLPEPMQRVEPPSGPCQDLAVDFLGPFPGGESILVVVDYYSRFFEVVVMKSTKSHDVIRALNPIFARYGYPFSLKSDNGPHFVSEEFEAYIRENGIQHVTSPPLWPQANGEVEVQNKSILEALKVAHAEGKRWQDELHKFLLAHWSTPHTST